MKEYVFILFCWLASKPTYQETLPAFYFQIILALVFLYLEFGPVIFAGMGAFLLIILVNVICGYFVKKWETAKLKAKGKAH